VFGDLINRRAFARLVHEYDLIMESNGSRSLLHSYVNLRSHPEFLGNADFSGAFIHPLLIALMAGRIGGPVRMVDARGNDAEPLSVKAQDNMLHIDNTPFKDEYKVLVTWEKGAATGPRGQNFVYLPGTQLGFRNSFEGADGHAWSTENGSIFVTPQNVDQLFSFQESVRGSRGVVEVNSDRPATGSFCRGIPRAPSIPYGRGKASKRTYHLRSIPRGTTPASLSTEASVVSHRRIWEASCSVTRIVVQNCHSLAPC
jgi:hypothetical protein